MAQNKTFYVNIIVNTARLMNECPKPSTDPKDPSGISSNYLYIIGNDDTGIHGTDSGKVNIKAAPGDTLCIHATSESRNFINPVILHGIPFTGGDSRLLSEFTLDVSQTADVSINGQAQGGKVHFVTMQSSIRHQGTSEYGVAFAVYNSDRKLHGCFMSIITITVD